MEPRTNAAIDMALDDVIMASGKGNRHRKNGRDDNKRKGGRKDDRPRGSPKRSGAGVRKQQRDERPSARRVLGGAGKGGLKIQVDASRVESRLAYASSSEGPRVASSLLVSNLHHQVSEQDLSELFGTVGKVLNVRLEYDRSGRSNGNATVHFAGQTDAIAASERFHNIPLDGLPMRISVVDVPRRPVGGPSRDRSDRADKWRHDKFSEKGQERREKKGPVSAEMLDDELDAYMMQKD